MKDPNIPTGGERGIQTEKNIINKQRDKLSETLEIPQELINYRESWKKKIDLNDEKIKERIIKAAEKISIKVEKDSDGSRLIKIKLGNIIYKILDPDLGQYTDEDYKSYYTDETKAERNFGQLSEKLICSVGLSGMVGDNTEGWKNQKLKEYVKIKETEGLHIAKLREIEKLLDILGNMANINNEQDKIAMLMYLTGIDGTYWLSEGKLFKDSDGEISKTRDNISFHPFLGKRGIGRGNPFNVYKNILMISSESI